VKTSSPFPGLQSAGLVSILGVASALAACSAEGVVDKGNTGGSSGVGGSSTVLPAGCDGPEVAMPKRLIRLSFNQLASSLRPIFGEELAAKVIADNQILPPTERTFPPLGDTSEGTSYIDTKWQSADAIATAAAKHAFDNFATFTGCTDAPTPECAKGFLLTLAERAYRRPLNDREKTSVQQVYDEVITATGTPQQAVQAGVWAIFESPQFLYRSEFGSSQAAGPLTPFELASQLSYFLTDAPPDADLLAAAAQNKLATDAEISAQVDRILALPATKNNLVYMVFAAYGIARVQSVVIDNLPPETFNVGVANSMFRESQLFINNVLWNGGKVSDLATSRTSFINAQLAPLYGVAVPTAVDADGFGQVELPGNRSGILTNVGFLTSRSRPDQQSVVGRGLAVNDAILCQTNPAFPEALAAQIEGINEQQHDLSERERANYRATTPPCNGCHTSFDPYGISLENFDVVGRFREMDAQGRAIDASVTLPEVAGGTVAMNAVEMGQALASSGAFSNCVASKLLTYALAETGVSGNSCAARLISENFKASDQSFPALVRAVAISKSLTQRSGG
jgi:hypothetical protein